MLLFAFNLHLQGGSGKVGIREMFSLIHVCELLSKYSAVCLVRVT